MQFSLFRPEQNRTRATQWDVGIFNSLPILAFIKATQLTPDAVLCAEKLSAQTVRQPGDDSIPSFTDVTICAR